MEENEGISQTRLGKSKTNLTIFPTELWACISLYLTGEQFFRLKFTGSKSLWSRLTAPHVVKSIILGKDYMHFDRGPAVLNELMYLEELSLEYGYHTEIGKWKLQLYMFPTMLRKLKIELGDLWKPDHFFCDMNGSELSLAAHLPLLEELDIGFHDLPVTHLLPPNLTSLRCGRWDCLTPLPPSIIHIYAKEVVNDNAAGVHIPPQLQTVHILFLSHPSCLLPLLPSSLTSFKVLGSYGRKPRFPSSRLPQNLKQLSGVALELPRNPEDLKFVQLSLTELSVMGFDAQYWPYLPHTLQTISFVHLSRESATIRTRIKDPVNGKRRNIGTVPVGLLPKSLTRLTLAFALHAPALIDFETSPRDPLTKDKQRFPSTLYSLKLVNAQLTERAARLLPPSLQVLDIENLGFSVCKQLPRSITSLFAWKTVMSRELIQSLPSSLTSLTLAQAELNGAFFNPYQFEVTTAQKFKAKYELKAEADPSGVLWCGGLPTNLTRLQLSEFTSLGDILSQPMYLNLTELILPNLVDWTDSCVPFLPRCLTVLDLSKAEKLSGKCFNDLPKGLESLTIGSADIFDDHIIHLPRSLLRLSLDDAIHLTNQSAKNFPRSLLQLTLMNNTKITIEAFGDLPFKLRAKQTIKAFCASTWDIVSGLAMPKPVSLNIS